ncbi:MAG TPA: RNA polymerase factor sigma-54 [Candidatus Coprenecus stercoravium]|uniref:RNA polymerase factor sigma-54 n=1 Tax=Candidatus Coprenecus stercoravium TaxID=2840735 RepID=A0A9D2GR33_9BACT|nr:RNA polymerase factor sigma-54 [Candidatus Coprenecus stercoravium]
MLKQGLQQKLQQGLSPLQIQTIKLLELPTLELEQRIKKELEENPVLDEAAPSEESEDGEPKNVSLSDYNQDDSTPSYRLYINNQGKDLKPQYNTFSVKESFHQNLEMQLGYSGLGGEDRKIASFIIGSIDDDGYLRRDIESLTDDIAFRLNIETTPAHVEEILKVIQEFEPVGVGARNLRECLLLQLRAKEPNPVRKRAEDILENYFDEFSRKHYDRIMSKTGMSKDELKDAMDEIVHLNPRPGGQIDDSYVEQAQQIVPDFILENKDGELILSMPKFSVPELRVNKRYADLLMNSASSSAKNGKEAVSFVKQKLDSAKWFIEAIKQRQNTLYNTMKAILDFQHDFFLDGDETKLRPMVLKNIAEKTGLDISTISRVVNCKYIQTNFGVYPLKYFFSEGMMTESGDEVSTREIKKVLSESIEAENKKKPLTDEELVSVLSQKGYKVARRTVAKYREQLNIPIARMRKEI